MRATLKNWENLFHVRAEKQVKDEELIHPLEINPLGIGIQISLHNSPPLSLPPPCFISLFSFSRPLQTRTWPEKPQWFCEA